MSDDNHWTDAKNCSFEEAKVGKAEAGVKSFFGLWSHRNRRQILLCTFMAMPCMRADHRLFSY